MTNYQPYNLLTPAPQPPARKRSTIRHIMWLGIISIIVLVVVRVDLAERAHAKAADAAAQARRTAAIGRLDSQFAQIAAANQQISLSIDVEDANHGMRASYNAASGFDAASTAKILSASLYLNQIEKGERSAYTPVDGYSLDKALELMVRQSDDGVWLAVNDTLGHYALSTYAQGLGLTSYDVDTNTISSADMTRLMMLLDKGDLLNQAHTALLLSYMQHTNVEDFIPPAVPPSMSVYHKVGLDNDEVNDTAIIKGSDDDMVITIYTNGNGVYDWTDRASLMQHIVHLAEDAYFQ